MDTNPMTTKEKILKNSIDLINLKGFEAVTLKEICDSANISKHTFYYYFSSKEDLLRSFFSIEREISPNELIDIINAKNNIEVYFKLTNSLLNRFEKIGVEILKQILILNLAKGIGTFCENDTESIRAIKELQIEAIRKAQDANEINNKSDPKDLLKTCFKIKMSLIFFWCVSNGDFDLKKAFRNSIEICMDIAPELRLS